MRTPGDWYVDPRGRSLTKLDGLLHGTYGNGRTPQEAVEDDWRRIALAGPDWLVIVEQYGSMRAFQWNGWLWEDMTYRLPKRDRVSGE